LLIDTAKESGFISDLLTGQTEMQNVPATTMLATIEQGTRAFKPIVQKLHRSLKREFKLWFNSYKHNLDTEKYVKFQSEDFTITKNDFDESLDIYPVADPTMSSEAHKYAKDQALMQILQTTPQFLNPPAVLNAIFTDMEFPNPESLIAQPTPPPPDPKMMEVQLKAQTAPLEQQIRNLEAQIKLYKAQAEHRKIDIKEAEVGLKSKESTVKTAKTIADAHKEAIDAMNEQRLTEIEAYNADTERQRVNILEKQPRRPSSSQGNS